MDCSLPGFSIHGIFQARVPEWVAISFSRESSQPRGSILGLQHCRQMLYPLTHQGSPGKQYGGSWRFLKKLKMELPYDPTIPLLGIHLEKNMIWKDTCTPMFTAALLTIAKTWKQSKCPLTKEWIKKKRCGTYIQWNITHPLKRKKSCHL